MGQRGKLDSRLARIPFDSQRSWTESMLKAEANGEDTQSNGRSQPETASMLVSMARRLHQLELDSVALLEFAHRCSSRCQSSSSSCQPVLPKLALPALGLPALAWAS